MPDFDDRLNNMFADFRNEVTPYVKPPGTAAARRWVRRRRRTMVAAIAGGAVLFVGGPATGFVAASQHTPAPPPIGPTELPTPGPTTPPPTPTAGPTTPPATTETSTPPNETLPEVTGKVFYLGDDGKIHLDGRTYPGGNLVNVTVSPDGRRVMWVTDPTSPDPLAGGDHFMSDLDGGNRRKIGTKVVPLCQEPVWSGDSSRVLRTFYSPAGANMAVVYLSGGAGDHLDAPEGCHYRWSADGKRVAFLDGSAESVTVHDLYGGGHRVTLDRDLVGGSYYTSLMGISADGDRVCVGITKPGGTLGDAGRHLGCGTVIDVSARKIVDLPIEGDLRGAVFTADGGMLARVRTDNGSELVRLDADDRVVARSVESRSNAERALLSYTP